ncbi:MAG TPA: inositol monophosphatase [Aliidongia sp.]|nr:inositol monophosphatase [Aliidongia sp.]
MKLDIEAVATLLRDAAAQYIVPRFRRLETGEILEKQPGDLVTIADIETERALAPLLSALIPGSLVVGEEAAAKDPSILDRLGGEDSVWLIDPVDGTANFAAGMPLFAVMVALVQAGGVVGSWIYDPIAGVMATAERGSGAWSGGRRLRVAVPAEPARMSGSLTLRFGDRELVRTIAGHADRVGSIFSLRCAGQEYLTLIQGRAHFALYHRTLPWDHAAGYLLHKEAGGYGRRLDGSAYSPRLHDGGIMLAPDESSWHQLRAALIG